MRHVASFAIVVFLLGTASAAAPADPVGDEDVRLYAQGMRTSLDGCEDPSVDIVSTTVEVEGSKLVATLNFRDPNAALTCTATEPPLGRLGGNNIRMVAASGPHPVLVFKDEGAYIHVAVGACTYLFVTEITSTGLRWEIPLEGTVEDFCGGDAPHTYSLIGLQFDTQARSGAVYYLPEPIWGTTQASVWTSDEQGPFTVTT